MTIGKNLKNLRLQHEMTLQELGDKIGKGKVHLSLLENEKTKPSDKKLQEILHLGFGLDIPEAKKKVDTWRMEEILEKGNISLSDFTNHGTIQNISGNGHTFNMAQEKNILETIKELKNQGVHIEAVLEALKK